MRPASHVYGVRPASHVYGVRPVGVEGITYLYPPPPHTCHTQSSSLFRHSFTLEDYVPAPNLELGCAVILHNCASDYYYIQTNKLCELGYIFGDRLNVVNRSENSHWDKSLKGIDCGSFMYMNRQ